MVYTPVLDILSEILDAAIPAALTLFVVIVLIIWVKWFIEYSPYMGPRLKEK
jgi:hypothetical protein